MRITDVMVVSKSVGNDKSDLRLCSKCGHDNYFIPQKVVVLSKSGARRMRLWACEIHPLPSIISDDPSERK